MKKLFVLMIIALFVFSCEECIEQPVEESINVNLLKSVNDVTPGHTLFFEPGVPFIREDGKPVTINNALDSPDGWESCFLVHVISNDEDGNYVSSAIVWVDGVEILNASDFSNTKSEYVVEVCDLSEGSELAVEIRGQPGSALQVWIEGIKSDTETPPECIDLGGKAYEIVKIGTQWWMAENLAYNVEGDGCRAYNDDEDNVAAYGRLYSWDAAMEACPDGWELPTADDWEELAVFVASEFTDCFTTDDNLYHNWYKVGHYLQINGPNSGWGGDNQYGFRALAGGNLRKDSDDGWLFENMGSQCWFWGSTTDTEETEKAHARNIYEETYVEPPLEDVNWGTFNSAWTTKNERGFSVRCIYKQQL